MEITYLKELIDKPLIRKDQPFEFLNKMTDEEIKQFHTYVIKKADEKGDIGFGLDTFTAEIDYNILYKLFKMKKK